MAQSGEGRGRSSHGGSRDRRGSDGASRARRGQSSRGRSGGPGGERGGPRGRDHGRRDESRGRPGEDRRNAHPEPELDPAVEPTDLDRAAKARLRTLSKDNADRVACHLVMAGRLIDEDPALAYEHAQAAVRRAGRVDVVREAAALTAYALGKYAEALRELRTVRRLSGVDAHRAIEADCERGLGRPERALALASGPQTDLTASERAELAIVASGARLDLDEPEAALLAIEGLSTGGDDELEIRLIEHRVTVLRALGRDDEAASLEQTLPEVPDDTDEIVFLEVPDLEADSAPAPEGRS